MGRNNYVSQKPLTAAEQGYFQKITYPDFEVKAVRNRLHSVGVLQPTATSDNYTVQIEYDVPKRPRVRVLRPKLRLSQGKNKLPHVFPGDELCLHLAGEWRSDQRISEFIVPWVSLWLFFYETWLLTGEWLGEGHEPSTGKK